MPLGNPQQQGGINPELIQMMMQMLQQSPQQPAGAAATGMPATAVPGNLRVPTETEQMMSQLLRGLQMPQAGQHALNATQGIQGGVFGGLGGRPRNS